MTDIKDLREALLDDISKAETERDLDAIKTLALGKKGSVSALLKSLGSMDTEVRKSKAPEIHSLKQALDDALSQKRLALKQAALNETLNTNWADVTLPVQLGPTAEGRIHPLSQVFDEVITIFADMGFTMADGPDIETDDYNFTKLNFPEGHPAREMQDTYFMPPSENGDAMVLRTQTSPVQIRAMLAHAPPIQIICPGRTYRSDDDATHTPMFHQVEGLVINTFAHMGHLKWVLSTFCKRFFELDTVELRFRPSFFPFTEPSMEVDVRCNRTGGTVTLGEGDQWMEILGCGMVNPKVLTNCNLDPEVYQGFAWGIGLDRLAMLKYGMPDLRAFFDADKNWLSHYGFSPFAMPGSMQRG